MPAEPTYTLVVEGQPFREDLTAQEVQFLVAALRSGEVRPSANDWMSLGGYRDSGVRVDVVETKQSEVNR